MAKMTDDRPTGSNPPWTKERRLDAREFADQVAKSRWLRIQRVNHVFALTLTIKVWPGIGIHAGRKAIVAGKRGAARGLLVVFERTTVSARSARFSAHLAEDRLLSRRQNGISRRALAEE